MLSNLSALNFHLTKAALQIDRIAFFFPMFIDLVCRLESMSSLLTAFKFADNLSATRCPMTFSLLILESSGASLAIKLRAVERLHDKTIDLVTKALLAPAVGARAILHFPLIETEATDQLVALLALFGLLDYLEAAEAREISVNFSIDGTSCL